jgi:hypothetical protein
MVVALLLVNIFTQYSAQSTHVLSSQQSALVRNLLLQRPWADGLLCVAPSPTFWTSTACSEAQQHARGRRQNFHRRHISVIIGPTKMLPKIFLLSDIERKVTDPHKTLLMGLIDTDKG